MNTTAGRDRLVLYLDYDGVLQHHNVLWHPKKGAYLSAPPKYSLFQHVELLEGVLAPYPQVLIVLSTSWVRKYGYSGAAKRLSPGLRSRVVGATFHTTMDERAFTQSPRGVQVWEDVLRRRPRDWLAVDDDYLDWPLCCRDKLVRTHEEKGISDRKVMAEFKRKLASMCKGGPS